MSRYVWIVLLLLGIGIISHAAEPHAAPITEVPSSLALPGYDSNITISVDESRFNFRQVILKFNEGTGVRLRDGGLRSITASADLRAFERLIRPIEGLRIERLFSQSESQLDETRQLASSMSGKLMPELNLYYVLLMPRTLSLAEIVALIQDLNALPQVQVAYPTPIYVEAQLSPSELSRFTLSDLPPTTPDFQSQQGYLNPAPQGVDAYAAWTYEGGTGTGVRVVDIEQGWELEHEDVAIDFIAGNNNPSNDHGTAVMGIINADNNGYGVTGIAYEATGGAFGIIGTTFGYDVSNAIMGSVYNSEVGDILLYEMHAPGPMDDVPACVCNCGQFGFIAVEFWQANFDATLIATSLGRVVVQASGNGSMDLDHARYGGAFDRTQRDSGAIMIAASLSNTNRQGTCWTNFGSRIDAHGWGENVVTTGYGDLFGGGDTRQEYTAFFSGTSSASPIVTGAAAAIQGVAKARGFWLDSLQMRDLLTSTGTPQSLGETRNIGSLPNLASAIPTLIASDLGHDTWNHAYPLLFSATVVDGQLETSTHIGEFVPSCAATTVTRSVWYSYDTAGQSSAVTMTMDVRGGTALPSILSLWRDDGGILNEVACDADLRMTATLQPNQQYYLMISDGGVGLGSIEPYVGGMLLSSDVAAAGYNDMAQPLTITSTSASYYLSTHTNDRAMTDPTPSCATGSNEATAWAMLTATETNLLQFSTGGSDYDTLIAVYDDQMNEIACADSGAQYEKAALDVSITVGETYYVMIAAEDGVRGDHLVLTVSEGLLNDTPAAATAIQYLDFTDTLNTGAAVDTTGDVDTACITTDIMRGSVWYTFTPAVDMTVIASTLGSSYDTVMAVFDGAIASYGEMTCLDWWQQDLYQENMVLDLQANTTYTFLIAGYNSTGNLIFNLSRLWDVPYMPTPLIPSGTVDSIAPNFSWTHSFSADRYNLFVEGWLAPDDYGTVFSGVVDDTACGGYTCNFSLPITLQPGAHTWWVQPLNANGGNDWTAATYFMVNFPAQGDLYPIAPEGWIADTTPMFEFGRSTDAWWHEIWLGDANGLVTNQFLLADDTCAGVLCQADLGMTLTDGTIYQYWWRGYNYAGFSPWTTVTYFGIAAVPDAPMTGTPVGTIADNTPDFVWEWDSAVHWYYIWLSDGISYSFDQWYNAFVICAVDTCTLPAPATLPDGDYTWWLQAWNPSGYSAWSGGASFTVDATPNVTIAPVIEVAPLVMPAAEVAPIQIELP